MLMVKFCVSQSTKSLKPWLVDILHRPKSPSIVGSMPLVSFTLCALFLTCNLLETKIVGSCCGNL
uniref:Uncharacterized protein n=1 Tax=Arundo donax TaxID=35708 RepID=A0A0A8YXP7_ARUDO